MPTGNAVQISLTNASTTPATGTISQAAISFGGSAVLQACSSLAVEVILNDPTNTGDSATFSVQIMGGLGTVFNAIGSPVTTTGLTTVVASSPFTEWQAVLTELTGGAAPTVTVRGVVIS